LRIFSINGTKLAEITEEQFLLEKDIQRLTEANLQQIFELDLVRSEFEIHGLRIDTLEDIDFLHSIFFGYTRLKPIPAFEHKLATFEREFLNQC